MINKDVKYYSSDTIFAMCGQVALFQVVESGYVSYRLEDYSIEVKNDKCEQVISHESSLSDFKMYCLGKYGIVNE